MNKAKQSKQISTECKVCRAPAIYSYFGAIVCQSCKIFFHRHAQHEKEILKCHFDGHCEINLGTRRLCSHCRLVKCFTNGMQSEMIRAPRTKTIERRSTNIVRSNQLKQFPKFNLLQSSQPTLTADQSNLLSNLAQCYDEYSGLSIGECFMRDQNLLPTTMRFKSTAVYELVQMTLDACQLLYKNNRDFVSLSSSDRSILLQHTFKHTASFSSNLITYKIGLINCPEYFNAVKIIANTNVIPAIKRLANRLDFDMIIMKLFLAIISFSTIGYTVYSDTPIENLSNIKEVLRIQNTYIELLWRYLVYKYGYKQAVKYCSDLIRSSFGVIETIHITEDVEWLTDTFDTLVQSTEIDLILID